MVQFAGFVPEIISYLGIPIIAALVGWGTNVLAIKMTFYPLEFKGIPPYLGWQGIIPTKAKSMAQKSVDMITTKLIDIDEQFQNIDSEQIALEMGDAVEKLSIKIVDDVMLAKAPVLWRSIPNSIRQNIYDRSTEDLPKTIQKIFDEVKGNIEDLFDIKAMVVDSLVNDKTLLNEIFLECGKEEFKFVKKSGFYFGFLFGLIQMVIWYFFKAWWFLPAAGLLVGYITNWIALKLIFHPLKPVKIGPFSVQGLFIKRQQEVSVQYGKLVKENIITSKNIFDSMLQGPKSEVLQEMISEHIKHVVEYTAKEHQGLIDLFYRPSKFEAIKNIAAYSFMEDFPILIHKIYNYTEKSLDIEHTLQTKMAALPAEDFSGFLRPIFQEDEWKLITVGAVLGLVAGFLQLVLLF